jgi:hypothetical protein
MGRSFTRSQVLDLVWSEPMRTLAARAGISDVGLKKAVLNAGLPVPPSGHWNRVLAGRPVQKRPALPPRGFGSSNMVSLPGNNWGSFGKLNDDDALLAPPVFDEAMEDVRRRAQRAIGRIRASHDFSSPHPAIKRVLDDETKRAEKVRTSPYPWALDKPRFTAPIDQRRLRVLNAIALAVSKADLSARLASKDDASLEIFSNAVSLPLSIQATKKGGTQAEEENRLSVLVGVSPYHRVSDALARWDDAAERKLESIVAEIAVDVAVLMEQRYRDAQVRQHEWLLQQRATKIESRRKAKIEAERHERERLKKMEQDRIERLLADADQLRRADNIRAYVEAAHLHFSPEARETFERWRTWALALADQIDPLRNGSFLLSMEEVDRPDTSHEDK